MSGYPGPGYGTFATSADLTALSGTYASPQGAWSSGTYGINTVVTYSGSTYRSKVNGNTATPGTDATKWESWGGGAVSSVAGRAGVVTLSASDIGGLATVGQIAVIPPNDAAAPTAAAVFDADSVSPQTDASSVSSWPEYSGGTALAQATGANQPILKTNIIAGHSVVRFKGGNYWMSRSQSLTASSGYSIALVGRPGGGAANYAVLGNSLLNDYNGLAFSQGQNTSSPAAAPTVPGWAVWRLVVASATSWTLYRNGVPVSSGTSASNITTLYLGQDGGANFYCDWDIAHLRVYTSTLTPEDGASVDEELGRRYGITLSPGTVRTRSRTDTTINSQNVRLAIPESYITGQSIPLVIGCHGASGDALGMYKAPTGYSAEAVLSMGMAYVANDMHGDTYGNAQAMTDLSATLTWVLTQVSVSKIIMFGQSLGGLPALNAIQRGALSSFNIPILGAALIYPITDMRYFPGGGGGAGVISAYSLTNGTLSAGASAGATSISSSVSYPAGTVLQLDAPGSFYELVTVTGSPTGSGPYTIPVTTLTKNHSSGVIVSDYGTKVESASYNPATAAASLYGNKRFRSWVSDADGSAAPANNTTPFMAAVSAASVREASRVSTRGGHGDASNFEPRDMALFFLRCLNDTAIV
jgi:hypothetical protein